MEQVSVTVYKATHGRVKLKNTLPWDMPCTFLMVIA